MSLLTQFLPKKDSKTYFIALALEESHIRAAVVEYFEGKAKVLGTGDSEFSVEKSETEAVDIAISMAEKTLPEGILVSNVIFALPQIYLEGEGVKPDYLTRLKKISRELDLQVIGYVEYASAISMYLESAEGAPPTVLLLDLTKSNLTVTLIRVGKIQNHIIVERSDSIVTDFSKTLPLFKAEILPSRIIIFEGTEKADQVREDLLKFPWHKHSIFLHTPKIEIFDNDRILTAFVETAATTFVTKKFDEEKRHIREEVVEEEDTVKEEEKKEESEEENFTVVSEKRQTESPHFGFIKESLSDKATDLKRETVPVAQPRTQAGEKPAASPLPAFLGILERIKLPKMPLNIIYRLSFLHLGIILPVLLFTGGFLYLMFVYPTATVALITYPRHDSRQEEVMFITDSEAEVDEEIAKITTRSINEEISGTKSGKTSGITQVGDKAKGEMTIYNKALNAISLTKGSVLSSGPLQFTLDSDVKVASASETTEGITFGKMTTKISASAIGPDGNLPANSEFVFKDFAESALTGKNNLPFSGGTSREIKSVSKDDANMLEEDLRQELVNQAKQQLVKKLMGGERLLDEPITAEEESKKFSAEVGSEARELTLDMTITFTGYTYNVSDLNRLLEGKEINAPAGFKFDPNKMAVRISEAEADADGNIRASATLTAYFIPDLDIDKIRGEIKGKSYNQVQDYLETVEFIAGVKISPEKKMPFLSRRLPLSEGNIDLQIITK